MTEGRHSGDLVRRLKSGKAKEREGAVREAAARLGALERIVRRDEMLIRKLGRENQELSKEAELALEDKKRAIKLLRTAGRDFRNWSVLSDERLRCEGAKCAAALPDGEGDMERMMLEKHGQWVVDNFLRMGPWNFSERICRRRIRPEDIQDMFLKSATHGLEIPQTLKARIFGNIDDRAWEDGNEDTLRMLEKRFRFMEEMHAWSLALGMGAEWGEELAKRRTYGVMPFVELAERAAYTPYGHFRRVMLFGGIIFDILAGQHGYHGHERAELGRRRAVMLQALLWHDVGKIFLPYELLRKTGITPLEKERLRSHPDGGNLLLRKLSGILGGEDMPGIRRIILEHHEKVSGHGYPRGKKGSEICEEGKIAAIADVFDAMTSGRPHHRPVPPLAAVNEIIRKKGCQFDEGMAEAFAEEVLGSWSLKKKIMRIVDSHGMKPD